MRTYSPKASEITRAWHVIDAEGLVLGRLCTEAARVLRGKHKPIFAPHIDTGDHVIIVNADKIVLTKGKADYEMVHRYSGYPGGLKSETLRQPARPQAGRRHPPQRPRHAAEGPARPSADQEAQGVRRARAPARRPEPRRPRIRSGQGSLSALGKNRHMATKPLTQTTGRRKEAVARARLRPGTGVHTINGRAFDAYFTTAVQRMVVSEALRVTEHRRGLRRRCDDPRRRRQRPGRRAAHGDRPFAGRDRSRSASRARRRPACSPAIRGRRRARSTAWSRPARPSSTPSAEPSARPFDGAHRT